MFGKFLLMVMVFAHLGAAEPPLGLDGQRRTTTPDENEKDDIKFNFEP